MPIDPPGGNRATVARYLQLSMVPDTEGGSRCMAPEGRTLFAGGASGAFTAQRHKRVKKRFLRADAVLHETGERCVFGAGGPHGSWPDGTAFKAGRDIDIFTVKEGLVAGTRVRNDSAEMRLHLAGPTEAPL